MNSQRVRPFQANDIPQVAELHRSLYRSDEQSSPELAQSYRGFFQDVYLDNPWYDETVGPLVCEDGSGKIIGFLGVMARPMRVGNRNIRAACSSMWMVDPNHRTGLAAVQLLKTFLSGPQDLSYADESTAPSRKLWERLGGTTSLLYSLHWVRPLRPAGLLNVQLSHRDGMRGLAKVSGPLFRAADAAIARVKSSPFSCPVPRLSGDVTDIRTLLECSTALYDSEMLRPQYDERALRWLLEMASHGEPLEKVAVRSKAGNVVGWYVYSLNRDRMAEVLQIEAKPSFSKDVVDHLLSHAQSQGAVAVTGRLDPRYLDDLGSTCTMRPRYWMLIHSRSPQLLNMLDRGEACLTRLEGEWCMQFHVSRHSPGAKSQPPVEISPPMISAPAIEVTAHEGGAQMVEQLEGEWRELCGDGVAGEPFTRPGWVAAYLRAFAPQEKAVVLTARSGGKLCAVLPLIEARDMVCGVPVVKLRGAANAHSCRFDLVRAAGEQGDLAVRALWGFLREMPDWNLIELPYVADGAALEGLTDAARVDGFPVGKKESMRSPYRSLSWTGAETDPLLSDTTANFRANVRRKERQLREQGELTLRCCTTADRDALDTFYRLEQSGWKGRQGTAIACGEDTRQFYDEIARYGEQFGYLRLYFLEFNGQAIAAQFGIAYGGRYFMPKLAFDEEYRKYGPGHLLIHAIMRDCAASGLTEYDFTGPWAEYKAKWSLTSRTHSTLTIFRRGLLGSSLHAAKFKVEAGVKDMLRPLRKLSTQN